MSQIADVHASKQVVPALKTPMGSDGRPVREWIDTLLQAAVIAKDKQKKHTTAEVEIHATVSTLTKRAANSTTADFNAVTATEVNEIVPAVAITNRTEQDTNISIAEMDAQVRATVTPTPPINDTLVMAYAEANSTVIESRAIPIKQYCRRKCKVEGCIKFARFNNACSGHGGRRLCAEAGCERVAQFGHKCSSHGGVKFCSIEGCFRAVQSRGCCKTHGGGVRCQHQECTKGAISKGFCRSHGGGSRCAEQDCQKWAQRHGYCVRHSKSATECAEIANQPDPELFKSEKISLPQPIFKYRQ